MNTDYYVRIVLADGATMVVRCKGVSYSADRLLMINATPMFMEGFSRDELGPECTEMALLTDIFSSYSVYTLSQVLASPVIALKLLSDDDVDCIGYETLEAALRVRNPGWEPEEVTNAG